MSCKCRDTDSKRCRVLYPTPDPWRAQTWSMNGAPRTRAARKAEAAAEILDALFPID